MNRPVPAGEWKAAYAAVFRRDAHQLLAWGYEDSRVRIHRLHGEEVITGFIAEATRSRLDDPATPDRFGRYSVHEERPTPGEDRTGRQRRRLDIVVEGHYDRPRPLYVFEAKRLCMPDHPLGDYVGADGLQRFISGEAYAKGQPEAGMLGYVQDRCVEDWSGDLRSRFDADATNRLRTIDGLRRFATVTGLTECWMSDHMRLNGVPICVCHIFLDCSISPD